MLKLNSLHRVILLNCRNLQQLQKATVAYQFKVKRPVYYPDRQQEMERINDQLKSQLVAETQQKKNKLPKDYYYKILGVRKNASMQQIKSAYYALAKRFHPDASNTPQETKRFQEISNAYHILTDESTRMEYDQMGAVKDEDTFLNKANVNVSRINNLMGNKKPETPGTVSEDLIHMTNSEPKLELTFLEAAHGVKKSLELRFMKKCPACNGKSPRLVNRTKPELCTKCEGTGQLTKKTPTFSSLVTCDQCHGKRYISRYQCSTCDSKGTVPSSVRLIVPVPAGTKTGEKVTVENPKNKQRVNYRINVKESNYYHRVGNDVHTDKYITITEAVLGTTCKVRGIYEDVDIKIEPGTESHTQVVLKGKGIRTREGSGNQVVTFKIQIPRELSMKQRQLLMALAKTEHPTIQSTA